MGFLKDQYKNRAWQHERTGMVEEQLKARGISDPKVLAAMETVPRELFIPEEYRGSAYRDGPLPIGDGQTISQPYMVALMTQCLALTGESGFLKSAPVPAIKWRCCCTLRPACTPLSVCRGLRSRRGKT